MKNEIKGNKLILTIDADEQAELRRMKEDDPDRFRSDVAMFEFFERLTANSELDWIDPGHDHTGDLTDAPMLGILGNETTKAEGPYGYRQVGHWGGKNHYQPLTHRWAFMNYALRSPLEDLLEKGEVVFTC